MEDLVVVGDFFAAVDTPAFGHDDEKGFDRGLV